MFISVAYKRKITRFGEEPEILQNFSTVNIKPVLKFNVLIQTFTCSLKTFYLRFFKPLSFNSNLGVISVVTV